MATDKGQFRFGVSLVLGLACSTAALASGPQFPAAQYRTGCTAPLSAAVGDLNRDGRIDLAFADYSVFQVVSVLLNNGDGTFAPAARYYVAGAGSISVAIGDLNGDDWPDLVVANQRDDNVSVLFNNGDGTFGEPLLYGAGAVPRCVAVGDLDGDEWLDLVVANRGDPNDPSSGGVSVLLNNGDGTLADPVHFDAGESPESIAVGDLDGDGTLIAPMPYYTGGGPRSIAASDLNGDQALDLAVADGNHAIVLLNNGDGTLGAPVRYAAGNDPVSVAIGDLDGDGWPDLALANALSDDVSVLLNNGDGTFAPPVQYGAGSVPYPIAVSDLNGDEWLDLAVANWGDHTVSVLLNVADGTFAPAAHYLTYFDHPRSIAAGDVDRDGWADLAVVTDNRNPVSFDKVVVLPNQGDGTFGPPVEWGYGVGDAPCSVAVGDLNGDEWPDLATANSGRYDVSVLLNDGDGTFGPAVEYGAGSSPMSVAIGDLDRDGWPDLATANAGDSNVSVLLNNGDGTFPLPLRYAAGSVPRGVAIAALNGDKWPDLAVANYSQQVTVLFNQRQRLAGDVDADGDVDWLDLFALLVAYGACEGDPHYNPNADIDSSGCVNLSDLAALLANYGAGA